MNTESEISYGLFTCCWTCFNRCCPKAYKTTPYDLGMEETPGMVSTGTSLVLGDSVAERAKRLGLSTDPRLLELRFFTPISLGMNEDKV